MTHQVGRVQAGIREEMPLPLDKATGPAISAFRSVLWGFCLKKPFPAPVLQSYSSTVDSCKFRTLLFTFLSLVHLELPVYEILDRDEVVICLSQVSPSPQPY